MCRLLLIENPGGIDPNGFLHTFAEGCRQSQEFQGHGWGCSWIDPQDNWKTFHHIDPIWQRPQRNFPSSRLFLAHARSAFRDEGIVVENNMPFTDGRSMFLFNGELRGVKIKASGRIGAEKIYNYIRRFDRGDLGAATDKAVGIINKRTRYIRAMNFFVAERHAVQVCSWFSEQPEYFQLRRATVNNTRIISSIALPEFASNWDTIPNQTIETIHLD